MIGKTPSQRKIPEKLGSGVMGRVYVAGDTNLSRQVAIKVLPDEFAHDAERRGRFLMLQSENRTLTSLANDKRG